MKKIRERGTNMEKEIIEARLKAINSLIANDSERKLLLKDMIIEASNCITGSGCHLVYRVDRLKLMCALSHVKSIFYVASKDINYKKAGYTSITEYAEAVADGTYSDISTNFSLALMKEKERLEVGLNGSSKIKMQAKQY